MSIRNAKPQQGSAVETLWSVEELRARVGLAPSSISRLVKAAILPHIRIGDRLFFRPGSIERWLRERESGGGIPRQAWPETEVTDDGAERSGERSQAH